MAFEDANIKEACEGHDFWNMVDSFDYNATVGDVLSTCADFSRETRHNDVLGVVAQPSVRDALLFHRQPTHLLLNSDGDYFHLLHTHMDQGNYKVHQL